MRKYENLLSLNNGRSEVNTAWPGWRSRPQDLGDQDHDDGDDDGHVGGVLRDEAGGAFQVLLVMLLTMITILIFID